MMKHIKILPLFLSLFMLIACSKMEPTQTGYAPVKEGKLFYQVFGEGDPIIVLHGGPGLDQTYLLPQMLTLAKNHKVIFYDQRGSGKSLDTPMTAEYLNFEQFVQDLDALRVDLGLDKITVLGHSWGGVLGMEYASKYPEHVSKLILMSTAPANHQGMMLFMKEYEKRTERIKDEIQPLFDPQEFMKLDASDINYLFKRMFSVYFYQPVTVEMMNINFTLESARGGEIVRQLVREKTLLDPNFDLFPQLKELKIPTLVITGKEDIIPVSISEEIKNAIPGAQLVILGHSAHFPYIEEPDAFFGDVNKFMNNTP